MPGHYKSDYFYTIARKILWKPLEGSNIARTVIDILINRVHHVGRVVTMNVHKRNIIRSVVSALG